MSSHCVVNNTEIKSVPVQTQLNSINVIELHVLTYLISSSGWHLVFKTKDFGLLDPWRMDR